MKVRRRVEFNSDLPTDTVETYDEIIQVGGKSVAEALAAIFADMGCDPGQPVYEGESGWGFNMRFGRQRLSCTVCHIEKFLVSVAPLAGLGWSTDRNPPVYVEVLKAFAERLAADPRFYDIAWCFQNEIIEHHPGSPVPVTDEDPGDGAGGKSPRGGFFSRLFGSKG